MTSFPRPRSRPRADRPRNADNAMTLFISRVGRDGRRRNRSLWEFDIFPPRRELGIGRDGRPTPPRDGWIIGLRPPPLPRGRKPKMENVRKWEIQIVRNVVNTCMPMPAPPPSLLPLLKCLQSLENVAGVPKYGYLRRIRSIVVKQMTVMLCTNLPFFQFQGKLG